MDSSNEFFYSHFTDTSDDSVDDDTDILVAAATLVHNFNETELSKHVGSVVGRAPALNRDRECGHWQLWKDYFHPIKPTYPTIIFRRRFRMAKYLFMRILEG